MGLEAPSHWVILLIAAALLFGGYKKLPEMSRSVGRSLRIFKTEMKGMTDDDATREAADKPAEQPAVAPVPPAAPTGEIPSVPPAPVVQPPAPAVQPPTAPAAEAPWETPGAPWEPQPKA